MSEESKDQRGALPRGICEECLALGKIARRLLLADGGEAFGMHCQHNQSIAVLMRRPDGGADRWRIETPATEADLDALMEMRAATVQGVVDGEEDLRQRRLAGLN